MDFASNPAWTHLYGIGGLFFGLLSLAIALRTPIKRYFRAKAARKQHLILEEIRKIETEASQQTDWQRIALAVISSIIYLCVGVALINLALVPSHSLEILSYLAHWAGSAALGFSIGGLSATKTQLSIKTDPQKFISKLQKKLKKDQ